MRFLVTLALLLCGVAVALPKPVAAPPAEGGKTAARDVTFKEASDAKLRLHIFAPPDVKPGDNRTAIVFFFGGGWYTWNPTQFDPFARHFAALGCVAICADYRVRSQHMATP